MSVTLLQMFELCVLTFIESYPLAFVFLQVALLTFLTSLVHSSLNRTTCRLQFFGLCLVITFLSSLLSLIPLLSIMVAYSLLAIMPASVLSVRTLYSVRQEMRLRPSLPMFLCWILDLPVIKV